MHQAFASKMAENMARHKKVKESFRERRPYTRGTRAIDELTITKMSKLHETRRSKLHPYLVGHTGKVYTDHRLYPLKMNRKYKNALTEQKHEKDAQILELSETLEIYWEHHDLILCLKKENHRNSNSVLLQELEDEMVALRKKLLHLKSKLDGQLPETLRRPVQEILNGNSKFVGLKKTEAGIGSNLLEETSSKSLVDKRTEVTHHQNSWAGWVKSQIFVEKNDSPDKLISIDLFSTGKNLINVLKEELKEDITKYNVTFGTKKIDMDKTLFDQDIFHGTKVNLYLRLQGGGKKSKKKQAKKPSSECTVITANQPELWSKVQVTNWISEICKSFEIEESEVSELKGQNGRALDSLPKEDWKGRSKHGDIFYNEWQKLKLKGLEHKQDEKTTDETINIAEEIVSERRSSNESAEHAGKTSSPAPEEGIFGLVTSFETLQHLGDFTNFSMEHTMTPVIGSIISLTGNVFNKEDYLNEEAVLFLRDEPQGASNYGYKIKIVIRGNTENLTLKPIFVETLLNGMNPEMKVAVKGRVEKLNDDESVDEPNLEVAKFKLVVDTDSHVLAFIVSPKPNLPKYSRLSSKPWWSEKTGDTSWNGKVGDYVNKKPERVFLDSAASNADIIKNVVGLRNSYDGDIFVGVDKSGKITGKNSEKNKMFEWIENLSKEITQIFPKFIEGAGNICHGFDDVDEEKCFVFPMQLCSPGKKDDVHDHKHDYIIWIHVPKGKSAPFYYKKTKHVHAYMRKGAETEKIENHEELFNLLKCLSNHRPIPKKTPKEELDIAYKIKEANGEACLQKNYRVLEPVSRSENDNNEMKMIFGGDPVETIVGDYLQKYACGFLNSANGTILFGVQEVEKLFHIVGIVISQEKRNELVGKVVHKLNDFYPPVRTNLYRLRFHNVVVPTKAIIRCNKSGEIDKNGGSVLTLEGSAEVVPRKKWPQFAKANLPDDCLSRIIPLEANSFCIVVDDPSKIPDDFEKRLEQWLKNNSVQITRGKLTLNKTKQFLSDLCIVELKVFRSRYPIHMIKPIETHVFQKNGELIEMNFEDIMSRFCSFDSPSHQFDVDKFLEHTNDFDQSGKSYILIASPFLLPEHERYIGGLAIPQWTLVIDFDQQPNQTGHLFYHFDDLHHIIQLERKRIFKTPKHRNLGLNPKHVTCWFAALGDKEFKKSLSTEDYQIWLKDDREPFRALLKTELTNSVKPNTVNIIVLWDDGCNNLLLFLQTILEDIFSICTYRVSVTFVCANNIAKSEISCGVIEPLQNKFWQILTKDRVHVVPPFLLSMCITRKLAPLDTEGDFQVPHKNNSGQSLIYLDILPEQLMKNISSYLDMMYVKKVKMSHGKIQNERKKFYCGSKISKVGLQEKFGIERDKQSELEREFKILVDSKSHVSMLFVQVDRGAGSSTICLQFLFKIHESYPCAELIEIGDTPEKLLSYLRDINKATRLPLVLFVDDEISLRPDFFEFTKKLVERRNINLILLLIEPVEVYGKKDPLQSNQKSTRIRSLTNASEFCTCPKRFVELRRGLAGNEISLLAEELKKVKSDKDTTRKLNKLCSAAQRDPTVRTFAHFGLTVFGSEFLGLQEFVRRRLMVIADEKQKTILSFLSLIHVYTDSHLPASTLANFLDSSETVNLDEEFNHPYLRELLSPPEDGTDSRRISFHEVAEEILRRLASSELGNHDENTYWMFIKSVSVKIAEQVLSKNIENKLVDRLTRCLFVTSDYESEKFSLLIRSMSEADKHIALNTLAELVDVFDVHVSFRAHILAHLAKYYMVRLDNFEEAMPRINEAVAAQKEDSLLRHIHGDIIRRHVRALKDDEKKLDMNSIVSHAIISSDSFAFVRLKRPHVSHGFISDAMVRIIVMQAANKVQAKELQSEDSLSATKMPPISFVDYLIGIIDRLGKTGNGQIPEHERYLLSLIPDAHQFLVESVNDDFEHKEKWKKHFMDCIGDYSNLRRLCVMICEQKNTFRQSDSIWLHEILLSIQSLNNSFEIDRNDLTPEEIELRITEIENLAAGLINSEPLMKFWVRYCRYKKEVPPLKDVKKQVKRWVEKVKKQKRKSPMAQFYNYVVSALVALQDPIDREKREKMDKLQLTKNYKKDRVVIPQEWLHPREGKHINSVDSLLHHDDLVKETDVTSGSKANRPERSVIEGYLSKKQVTRWSGRVKDIQNNWNGTILFKGYFEIRFVPQNVQPTMPDEGDCVAFCLAFDRIGLSAWWVRIEKRHGPLDAVKTVRMRTSSFKTVENFSSDEENDSADENVQQSGHFESNPSYESVAASSWQVHIGKRMHGVVISTEPSRGFGYLKHPDVSGRLFFHASQIVEPVISLKGNIEQFNVLEFQVELFLRRPRATDIHKVKPNELSPELKELVESVKKDKQNSTQPTTQHKKEPVKQTWEKGKIKKVRGGGTYGFIEPDNSDYRKEIFVHIRHIVNTKTFPNVGERVRFYVIETEKGVEARQVCVQGQSSISVQNWGDLQGRGIQEGFVESVSDDRGYIKSGNPSGPGARLLFYHKDIRNKGSQDIEEGIKVHFQINKRGGNLIAVNIHIIAE